MQLFVLGMHRSGTSALSRILNLMGAYFGGENVGTGRNAENPKGFWERRDVRDLNDAVLFDADCDWDCVSRLELSAMPEVRRTKYASLAMDVVMAMDAHRPWFLKEPRLCVLFPIWREAVDLPVCIHIYRNPLEVAHSLQTRNDMPVEVGLALWEIYNIRALQASAGLPGAFVCYEDLLAQREPTVRRLHAALSHAGVGGLRMPSEAELSFAIDDGLHHERQPLEALEAVATASQRDLFYALRSADEHDVAAPAPTEECLATLRDYEATVDVASRRWRANARQRDRSDAATELRLTLKTVELDHATRFMQDATRRNRELERQNDGLRNSRADLRVQLEVNKQTAERLAETNKNLTQRNVSLDQNRATLERDKAALERDKATLEHEKAALEGENAALERDKATLEGDKAALEGEKATLEGEKATLEGEKATLEGEKATLEGEKATLEGEKATLEGEKATLEGEKATLEGEKATLERDKATLEGEKTALEGENAALEGEKATLEGEKATLEGENAALEGEKAALEGEKAVLERDKATLEGEKAALERDKATLERENAALEREKVTLGRDLAHECSRISAAIEDASMRRDQIKSLVTQREAILAHQRAKIARLKEDVGDLDTSIINLLRSRRWRVGNALLRLASILAMRRRSSDLRDRLQSVSSGHSERVVARRAMAAAQQSSLNGLTAVLPGQTDAVRDLVGADKARDARLTHMLVARELLIAERNLEIVELGTCIHGLIEVVEALRVSRRWRIGHFLLSLPRVVVGRGKPATDLDAVANLIEAYRRTPVTTVAVPELDVEIVSAADSTSAPTEQSKRLEPFLTKPASYRTPNVYQPAADVRVDIVVCVHNALDHVEQCLASVLTRTTVGFRLIVVNDGSDETTTTRLRALANDKPEMEVIETNGPLGYTRAANVGLRASSAPLAVLLNSDTIVPRLWLEGMLECMNSDHRLGIVGPLSNAASWQSVPEHSDADGWVVNELPNGYTVDEFSEMVYLASERRFPHVDFLNGFCLMIRRTVIEQIGYLDEETFPRGYGEENDYCLRTLDAGFELAIADHCYVYHAKSKSFGAAARDVLAQAGGEALERKHGAARIDAGTRTLRDSFDLARARDAVKESMTLQLTGVRPSASGSTGWRVLFVLPVKGGSGGANSIVQEAAGMCALGVHAEVAVHAKYQDAFVSFYEEYHAAGIIFFFDSDDELFAKAADFHVVVATLWSTPALIAPMRLRWPDKLYVYYVQDYEPWFFPHDVESRKVAENSYTLLPDMALMAKTDWICDTVAERHGRPVYRAAPSLDHALYYPGAPRRAGEALGIAAMIRPKTPRRAPLRTLRVLKRLASRTSRPLRILIFGCEMQELRAYVQGTAPGEDVLGFNFENCGTLTRAEVAELLRSVDVFADLSDYQAFGRTGLEAMACGCAVVLPANGGVYEYAVDDDNARIVDTQSVEGAAAVLQDLIEDDDARQRLQRRAVATASRYDIVRSSLSELAVFRSAWVCKNAGRNANADSYRRGVEPLRHDNKLATGD